MRAEKQTIHIVHFTSLPGGIEVLVPEITRAMKSYDFKAFVIRPPISGKANVYDGQNIPVTYGDHSNRKAMLQFLSYIRKHKNDIFHLYNAGPFYTLMLRLAGAKKVIFSIHGTIYWKTYKEKILRKIIWKLAFSKQIIILANSAYSKLRFVKATGYNGTVEVVYNPIDGKRYSKIDKEKNNDSKKIIYCGRLEPGKNLFKWLDAAKVIIEKHPSLTFELYGQGKLREALEKYADELCIRDKVDFKGFTKDIEHAYRQADLMVFLSEYESFGNVVVESILCGTPVIASAIPSMKEIFKNFPEFMVKLDNNLEANILNKVNHLDSLQSLVPKAIEEFNQRFSLAQHIEKLDEIYQSFNQHQPTH